MKVLLVARKTLLEYWREPQLFLLLLIFPLLLIGVYYLAFGPSDKGMAQVLQVVVVNQDQGAAGGELVQALREAKFEGQPVFTVLTAADAAEAQILLLERKAALLLTVPPDWSRSLAERVPARVILTGDVASDYYVFAASFLEDLLRLFGRQISGQPEAVSIAYEFLPGTGTMSDWNFGVPGLLIFANLFLIISTATVLVREKVHDTLRRLRLARVSAADLLLGVTLAQMAVAAIQVPLAFVLAIAFGFGRGTAPLGFGSLLLGGAIALLLSLAASGLGLVVAAFSRNDGDAVNLGTAVLLPVVFLSGAIFPMPKMPLGTILGHPVSLYDLMPSTHAAEAMRQVLVFGVGPGEILYELGGLALLSALYLAGGVGLYQGMRMRGGGNVKT